LIAFLQKENRRLFNNPNPTDRIETPDDIWAICPECARTTVPASVCRELEVIDRKRKDHKLWKRGYLAALSGYTSNDQDNKIPALAFHEWAKESADLFVQTCHEYDERSK
jgi:hypothetical protein